jgi:hypothetical protein
MDRLFCFLPYTEAQLDLCCYFLLDGRTVRIYPPYEI